MATANPNKEAVAGSATVRAAVRDGLTATSKPKGENWLEWTDADYAAFYEKWVYVHDHLAGLILDKNTIPDYLHKRKQGEHDNAYDERVAIADYTPHYSRAVITLAGMLWAVEDDAKRVWNEDGLGNPLDDNADAAFSPVWENSDGCGTNWPTLFQSSTVDLIGYHRLYAMVDGVRRDDSGRTIGRPSIKILPPQSVTRVIRGSDGSIRSAKIKFRTDPVDDQRQKPDPVDQYFIYYADGYEVWQTVNNHPTLIAERVPYGTNFQYVNRDGVAVPPIVEVSLPFRTHVGYLMARKANAIFNQENTLDFLLWVACFPKLFADVRNPRDGSFDKAMLDALKQALAEGNNVIPGANNKFDAPPMSPATEKRAAIGEKVLAFYATFFQAYGDSAKEKSATEVRQDFRAGISAFLVLLASAVDDLENGCLWFLEQAMFPSNPDYWGRTSVERSRNFQPVETGQRIRELIARHTPAGYLPLDPNTLAEIAVKSLEDSGIAVDPVRQEAILTALNDQANRNSQAASIAADFGLNE